MRNNIITFENQAQKILWDSELSGQLSDGWFKGSRPLDHWKEWCYAQTVVGENPGVNFYATKNNYNFTNRDLLEIVGERMVEEVQKQVDPEYDMKKMRKDLRRIKEIIKLKSF